CPRRDRGTAEAATGSIRGCPAASTQRRRRPGPALRQLLPCFPRGGHRTGGTRKDPRIHLRGAGTPRHPHRPLPRPSLRPHAHPPSGPGPPRWQRHPGCPAAAHHIRCGRLGRRGRRSDTRGRPVRPFVRHPRAQTQPKLMSKQDTHREVLSLNADLAGGLRSAARDGAGAAFLPDALPADACARIVGELASARFSRLQEHEGRARQEGEILVIRNGLRDYPAIRRLRRELVNAAYEAADEIAGLASWEPNEVSAQRYLAGSLGITPHLDLKRYRYLIVVATVEGTADFTLCKNRQGDLVTTWRAETGSLILLRGPGLGGADDGRPLHAVAGPPPGPRAPPGVRLGTTTPPPPGAPPAKPRAPPPPPPRPA